MKVSFSLVITGLCSHLIIAVPLMVHEKNKVWKSEDKQVLVNQYSIGSVQNAPIRAGVHSEGENGTFDSIDADHAETETIERLENVENTETEKERLEQNEHKEAEKERLEQNDNKEAKKERLQQNDNKETEKERLEQNGNKEAEKEHLEQNGDKEAEEDPLSGICQTPECIQQLQQYMEWRQENGYPVFSGRWGK